MKETQDTTVCVLYTTDDAGKSAMQTLTMHQKGECQEQSKAADNRIIANTTSHNSKRCESSKRKSGSRDIVTQQLKKSLPEEAQQQT